MRPARMPILSAVGKRGSISAVAGSGAAQAVHLLEQCGDAVGTVHLLDTLSRLDGWNAGSGDIERMLARAAVNLLSIATSAESILGYTNDGDFLFQRIEKVSPHSLAIPKPDVAVHHDGIDRVGELLEDGQNAGQFTLVELAGHVVTWGWHLEPMGLQRLGIAPIEEGERCHLCDLVTVIDVYAEFVGLAHDG